VSHLISVQLDALAALLAELSALGVELAQEGELCAATGRSLAGALEGPVGVDAGLAGAGWTELVTTLAARTLAVAASLEAAVATYRAADAGIAGQLDPGWAGRVPVPR
jgi:hypothetical protein